MFSWSSLTRLWERIFDLRSQKNFFDTQSWQVVTFSHIDSVGNVKFGSEISMKTFFHQNFSHPLYCNVNTFRSINKTWKAFIVLSQAVNDTSGSAHELQGSLKTHITTYKYFTSHRCREEVVNSYFKRWKICERHHNVFKVLQSR